MRIVHQMNLPQSTWDDFINSLTHYDAIKQAKVNAFLKEIDQNISITREPNKIIIESQRLDECAILSALQTSNQSNSATVCSDFYDIQVNGFFDFDAFDGFVNQIAREDFYQTLLIASEHTSSEYISTDMDKPALALAA